MSRFRLVVGLVLLFLGLLISCIATIGVYKFKFAMNRMHSAALGDTLAILFVLLGLIILNGWNFVSLKLFLIICLFWVASPVSSHLLARMELTIAKKQIKEECEVQDDVHL